MSKTFLSRLAMLEVLDAAGPLTISELAHRSGLDVAVVSRTVAACEGDGWLTRAGGKIAIGPRTTLLGHFGPLAEVIARAAPLVHAVAGVTGLLTHAYSLVGASSVLVAVGPGRDPGAPPGLSARAPLHATAAGHAIAVQLDASRLERVTTAAAQPPLPGQRDELQARLDLVRKDGFATDPAALDPAIACIAVPWPQPGFPSAIACLGLPEVITASRTLVRRVLALAAQPGSTPNQIITGAAEAIAR